jgi:hypothetical protein
MNPNKDIKDLIYAIEGFRIQAIYMAEKARNYSVLSWIKYQWNEGMFKVIYYFFSNHDSILI